MKQKYLIPALVILPTLLCCRKPFTGEELRGYYVNAKGSRKMEIRENNRQYYGIITWVQDAGDQVSPGDTVLRNLQQNGNKWKAEAFFGTSSYNCTITMPDQQTLRISAMGQAREWKKY